HDREILVRERQRHQRQKPRERREIQPREVEGDIVHDFSAFLTVRRSDPWVDPAFAGFLPPAGTSHRDTGRSILTDSRGYRKSGVSFYCNLELQTVVGISLLVNGTSYCNGK